MIKHHIAEHPVLSNNEEKAPEIKGVFAKFFYEIFKLYCKNGKLQIKNKNGEM